MRCGKKFARSRDIKRHLVITKPCEAKYLDIDRDEILNNYEECKKKFESMFSDMVNKDTINNNSSNLVNSNTNNLLNSNTNLVNSNTNNLVNSNDIICQHCSKHYASKASYDTHQKYYCNVIKEKDQFKKIDGICEEIIEKRLKDVMNAVHNRLFHDVKTVLNESIEEFHNKYELMFMDLLRENNRLKAELLKFMQ